MRLHVLSDLHLERAPMPVSQPEPPADVLVLAGDTAGGTRGVEWARERAAGRPVLYVAGNHEFYGHASPGLIGDLRAAAAGSSVHVLENDELVIDGVRFLGCTLWSDFEFDGPDNREVSMRVCARVVNDFEYIEHGPAGRPLSPADARTMHLQSRRWLADRLAEPHPGPTVVVTHHQPVIVARPESPALRAIAGAFASDLSELMGAERVALWIFGHTHRLVDLDVGGTRVISNPRGYPHEPVDGFDPTLVAEVDAAR